MSYGKINAGVYMKLEEDVSKTYLSKTIHSVGEANKPLQEFTYSMETNTVYSEWVRALAVPECYLLDFGNSIRKPKNSDHNIK